MNSMERQRFDHILDQVIAALPAHIRRLLEDQPIIVDDHPGPDLLDELGMTPDEAGELCGLHTGIALTERSIEDMPAPEAIHLFRDGIVAAVQARQDPEDVASRDIEDRDLRDLREEIRITLLHELGHHVGLDEDDLDALGYG